MADTFHLAECPEGITSFVLMTQPFMPQLELTGVTEEGEEQYVVNFNQGYIFDYANGGQRVEVAGMQQPLDAEKINQFAIDITIDHIYGSINSAEIKNREDSGGTTIYNLQAESQIEGTTIVDPAIYSLDLAEFDGYDLTDLYIRENIHLHFRGHRQLYDSTTNEGHAVMKNFNSPFPNGTIDYRAIVKDPREDNSIEITTVGNNIYFYSPGDSGSA